MKRSIRIGNRIFRHHKVCETITGQILRAIQYHNINFVFDVGANKGQYARELFSMGYNGKIISFEPVRKSYDLLFLERIKNKYSDCDWEIHSRCAIGEKEDKLKINVSDYDETSSFLQQSSTRDIGRDYGKYIGKEVVPVHSFDNIFKKYEESFPGKNYFLKLDVEGYEWNIFKGMKTSWKGLKGIQVESAFVPLWDDAKLYQDIIKLVESKGFKLFAVHSITNNEKTGQTLAFDLIFFKEGEE